MTANVSSTDDSGTWTAWGDSVVPARANDACDKQCVHNMRIEQIWLAFHRPLRSFLLSRTRNPHVADDLLQDVFVKVHRSIGALRDDEGLSSWLFRVARNTLIDHYRTMREGEPIDETESIPAPQEDGTFGVIQDLAAGLFDLLEALPPRYREALRLTEVEGLTQAEMAKRLDISLSGGKSRVHRARERLKRLLLECCDVELDHRGGIMSYTKRPARAKRQGR